MICELRREEEEGLLTAVGDRESWKEKGAENVQGLARRVRMSPKKKKKKALMLNFYISRAEFAHGL